MYSASKTGFQTQAMRQQRKPKAKSYTLSHRVNEHYLGLLQKRVEEAEKAGIRVSLHQMADQILINDLDDRKWQDLASRIDTLQAETEALRQDLARLVTWLAQQFSRLSS